MRNPNKFLDDPRMEDEKQDREIEYGHDMSKEMSRGKQDLWIHRNPAWNLKNRRRLK